LRGLEEYCNEGGYWKEYWIEEAGKVRLGGILDEEAGRNIG